MNNSPGRIVLLIDYENVQNIDFHLIEDQDIDIKIFVGGLQRKIPIELVQSTQKLGPRVEWIRLDGSGNNALDFHIAFHLGRLSLKNKLSRFAILSKDKGFDPLLNSITKESVNCKRIESLAELLQAKSDDELPQPSSPSAILVAIENLSKIQKNKRPRTRKTLGQHISNLLKQKKIIDQSSDSVVNTLFSEKKISENANRLSYNF
jgi:hypothetical protein